MLLDGFFGVINKIWRYDFFNNEYVTKIFNGAVIVACSWLVLKVLVELIMNYIVRNEGKESPLSVYRGIVLAIVMMFLIPTLFQFGHDVSSALTDSVISVSNMSQTSTAETTISNSIVRAMVYTNETKSENITKLVNNWKTININETEGGFIGLGDCYKYSVNFFMLIILAIVTIFLLFFVAIQMAKRVMEIALYKIIGPFCATSLTTNQPRAFEMWCKSSIGLFLTTVVQFISIGLLMTIFGSAFSENGLLTGIFLIIGALLFIISTPTLISSLLNQQSGLVSGMGDMQSLFAMTQLTGQGIGLATAGVSGALSLGAKVVSGGSNLVGGGISRISNMMNRAKTLTPDQKSSVQDSINNHNPYKAQQQVKEYLNQNSKGRYGGSSGSSFNSNFNHLNNMRFNTMRNQYTNNHSNNVSDRKWY